MSSDTFKGVSSIGDPQITEIIRDNLITFNDWAFLQIGAFFNITVPSSGAYGGNRHELYSVRDPRYNNGQVWGGYRQNWVWESGVSYPTSPISISGIFVDNVFQPLGSGYHINYPEGRVVFDTAIALNSDVHLEYSHKWIKVTDADNIPWFREIQYRSFRADDSNLPINSGIWSNLSQTNIQLPLIAIQAFTNRSREGYEIGNSSEWTTTQVVLHIVAEDGTTADRITDILDKQSQKTLFLFDTGLMSKQNRFPLDYQGSIASGALTYPDLIRTTNAGGFRYNVGTQQGKLRIAESNAQKTEKIHHNIHHNTVRWDTEVILLQD